MTLVHLIRKLASALPEERELDEPEAHQLFAALLDGGVDELETGAVLVALAMRPLSAPELVGMHRAAQARVNRLTLQRHGGPETRPIVIPSYGGARQRPNLMPLVALLLARFGVATLVHGMLESHSGVASAHLLRELGVLPCAGLAEAQCALERGRIAFVPTALLAPALARLLALRARIGVDDCARRVAALLDPFGGDGMKLVPARDPRRQETLGAVLQAQGECALVFVGSEGEAYPDPEQRPAIDRVHAHQRERLFDADPAPLRARGERLPRSADARDTARWIECAVEGRVPLPQPIMNLLACCLYTAGYTADFGQSKAIVAVRAHRHAPA